jgi:hypothetical protein
VCIHHMARVWHNTTTLRAAMLKAERRLEQTQSKLAVEQRAHEATKQRLAKLEGRKERPEKGEPMEKREKVRWRIWRASS